MQVDVLNWVYNNYTTIARMGKSVQLIRKYDPAKFSVTALLQLKYNTTLCAKRRRGKREILFPIFVCSCPKDPKHIFLHFLLGCFISCQILSTLHGRLKMTSRKLLWFLWHYLIMVCCHKIIEPFLIVHEVNVSLW